MGTSVALFRDRLADLAVFVLRRLDHNERGRFEGHTRGLEGGRAEPDDLLETSLPLQFTAPVVPRPELRDRILRAIRAEPPRAARIIALRRRPPLSTALVTAGACAALALAVGVGALVGGGETMPMHERQSGVLERITTLASLGGGTAKATARITRVGAGRVIELRSSTLPKLRPSQYYELWFVGARDAWAAPERVSAGTFHPDSRGRVVARFLSAANPSELPVLAVTRESRDGDPAATAPDVLRPASMPGR
jgi:Anti-sigma-K factor rskA, C-terminal